MEIGMVRESKGAVVAVYDGGIPRGETLMEKAIADHLWGSTWRVKKATIVGEPVRHGNQWEVSVQYLVPQWKGEPKVLTTHVPARMILCPWEHFEVCVKAQKNAHRKEREEAREQEKVAEKRWAAIEAALRDRGVDTDDMYVTGDHAKLTYDNLETLLGLK